MSEKASGWGLPENASSKQVQSAQPYRLQSANRGGSWWPEILQPEYRVSSSDTWDAPAGGAHAWDKNWGSQSSGWNRPKWSALIARHLVGSDFDTDRGWHACTMRYSEG